MNFVKKALKNERGMTLIELLAVVVIIGIIAAIAIPSIGGLIDNTKKDAHVSNAKQMISSAKIWVAANTDNEDLIGEGKTLYLKDMIADGQMDAIEDPDNKKESINAETSFVLIKRLENKKSYSYTVKEIGSERGIYATEKFVKRSNVNDKDSLSLVESDTTTEEDTEE